MQALYQELWDGLPCGSCALKDICPIPGHTRGMQRLRAVANQLRAGDQVVRLRGVNLSGLEYSRGVVTKPVLDEIASWGANFLRCPSTRSGCSEIPATSTSWSAPPTTPRCAASTSCSTCMARLRPAPGQQPRRLQRRYSALARRRLAPCLGADGRALHPYPAVMFDLLNEPHDRLAGDAFPLFAADGSLLGSQVGAAEWHPWVRRLAAEIRRHAPETPLFVSGTDWGFQLAPLDLDNVVQASHIYPYPGKRTRADWERALAVAAPVVVTELGPIDGDLGTMRELLDFLDEKGYGWAAWSWRGLAGSPQRK